MAEESLIAVFIDYENLALGVHDMKPSQRTVDIGLVLKRLLEKGRIVYKRAYCDWSSYRKQTPNLHQHGVVMVDIPHTGVSGKNSADIHMVVDALDLCFSKEHIETFALLTGDSDFSPLVYKLRELDKRVIGCGVKNSTSSLLLRSCDEFIYYDDLVRRQETKSKARRNKAPSSKPSDRKDEGVEQVMEVIRSLAEDYENVWASMIKQTIGRLNPGFNHEYYGYQSFNAMLKDMSHRKLVELDHDRHRGNYIVHLNED
ncbi:MAG: NYN domain-containing protein [Myxococcota bacterium]